MNKRKTILLVVGALFLIIAFSPGRGDAGVHVSVGINLPVFRFAAPPALVVLPGTYAYFVPDAGVEIFFYHDYWYRPYEGRWYRATNYNGPWAHVVPGRVPGFFLNLPPNYRHVPPGHERIPYGQFRKNWRRWERERYWDRHDERGGEHGAHGRRGR
jgi:hypothetical protein